MPAFGQQPIGQQVQQARGAPPQPMPKASETKSQAILQDSQDPNFARNLAQLGQVAVPGKGQPAFRTDNAMIDILAERQRAEEALEQAPPSQIRNQLSARGLANLFDDRKLCKSQSELDELAREYGMDPATVEALAKHINTPAVSEIPLPSSDPNEPPKRLAKWVDPLPPSSKPQIAA
ncbi:uncharacterized protein JCM10292_002576 [Rhodotorula paludigena]|uniref:uncharacterized protein n=1 Tax=Rhodotorula paludigena TaxID=86838 RepID=UPI00317372BB